MWGFRCCGVAVAAASPQAENSVENPRKLIILSEPARSVVNGKVVEPPWYVASPAEGTIKIWLVDTGCGHDLIGKNEVASSGGVCRPAGETLTFNTANGKTEALEQACYKSAELNEEIDAYVLDSTPAVISVGKRCMNMGYSFHWPSGKNPYLICPDGIIVELDVHGDIPYLRAGSRKSAPKKPTREILVPSLLATLDVTNSPVFDAVPGEEDGGNSVDLEEELSETDHVDPTDEYTEVEQKSLRE